MAKTRHKVNGQYKRLLNSFFKLGLPPVKCKSLGTKKKMHPAPSRINRAVAKKVQRQFWWLIAISCNGGKLVPISMLLTKVKIGTKVHVAINKETKVAVTEVPCLLLGAIAIATTVIIDAIDPWANPHKNRKNNNSLKLVLNPTIILLMQ